MSDFKYFSPETDPALFRCSETGETGIKDEFVLKLDDLREACGFPFIISSGYRSPRHSIEAKKPNGPGRHSKGDAADIATTNSRERYAIIKNAILLGFTGIGVHKKFIHVDTRPTEGDAWPY